VSLNINQTGLSMSEANKYDQLRGTYKFENKLYEGKPYYVKRVQATAHYIYFAKNTWNLAKRLGATSLIFRASMPKVKMANATGGCPESAGKWQQKNMIGMWKNYDRLSLSCAQSGSGQRPLFLTTTSRPAMVPGQTARPAATTIGPNFNSVTTKKPIPHWTDPPPKPLPGSNDLTAQLKSAGCKCHAQTGITVVSTDSRTKSKHADQLGKYQFKGQMHSGRPVYVNAAGTYSMYWNANTKAWEVGKSVGGTAPTMKTQEKTDQICPADPVSRVSKKWTRKNMWGIWGRDKTLVVKCL